VGNRHWESLWDYEYAISRSAWLCTKKVLQEHFSFVLQASLAVFFVGGFLGYFLSGWDSVLSQSIQTGIYVIGANLVIGLILFFYFRLIAPLNLMKQEIDTRERTIKLLAQEKQNLQMDNQVLSENLAIRLDITLGDVEANFDEEASDLNDLFEYHQLRSGKKKQERRYKLIVHNLSKGKSIKNVHVDLIDIEIVEVDPEEIPAYLNCANPLKLLRTQLPLRLCFTNHQNPPYLQSIELDPMDKVSVDVVRWEFDGDHFPTFFLCHIRQGVRAEIPLGKYKLTVQVSGENVPKTTKMVLLDKLNPASIEDWGLKEINL